ncbi:DHA2 family efflux MFS transporter permease subunit [Bacillus massiliglaciei]|uniref:DHA2 family efflux MFS transporter permease subunit n=1 Tax=Bacillus massiliglaciei TaxID=1816693 RepID=UPI000AA30246|nr:DHA2 family efflux MFS transporter permease subunit [Bacillus massiliglaciei]
MEKTNDGTQIPPKQYKSVPIIASFLIAGFIGLFSETALNMALRELIEIFGITPATGQWLTTGFLLTLGVLMPVSGLILQWFTTRQLFILSVIFSIIGSLIAALAPTFEVLMVARVVQAVGTALLLPLMFNTILVIIPPHKRGGAMGIIGLVIMFAPAVGPTISGLILEHMSWHGIFWVTLPFLAAALLFGYIYMENVSTPTKPKIDLLSIILSTLGFGGIVFGFSYAGEGDGWGSPVVITSLIIGVIGLFFFCWRQFKMEHPVINLRAFSYPMFTLGLILILVGMMIILSTVILLPLYLQTSLMLATFTAGLILLPGGVINGILSPVMGRLFDKFGPTWLVIPGFIVIVTVLSFFANISADTSALEIIVLHIFLMIGVSMIMMPAQTNGLNQLPPELYPDGTAIMNTLQQVAGAVGTAVAISIMSAGQTDYLKGASNPADPSLLPLAFTAGVKDAFIFALVVSIIGLVLSFFVKRVKVKQQMH